MFTFSLIKITTIASVVSLTTSSPLIFKVFPLSTEEKLAMPPGGHVYQWITKRVTKAFEHHLCQINLKSTQYTLIKRFSEAFRLVAMATRILHGMEIF